MLQFLKDIWISRKIFTIMFIGFLLTILPLLIALSTYQYYDEHFYHLKNGYFKHNYALEFKNIRAVEFAELRHIAENAFQDASVITGNITATYKDFRNVEVVGLLNDKLWSPALIEGNEIMSDNEGEIIAGGLIASHPGPIKLWGQDYHVKGIAGKDAGRDLRNVYNLKVFIGLNELPEILVNEIKRNNELRVMVRSKQNPIQDIDKFISDVKLLYPDTVITTVNVTPQLEQEKKSRQGVNEVLNFPYRLTLIALVNGINVSYLWIYLKRKEIALRKALGASNIAILGYIWSQLLACAALAAIGSSFLQWILSRISLVSVDYTFYHMSYNVEHFIIALLTCLAVACLTSAIPLFYTIRIEPARALKE